MRIEGSVECNRMSTAMVDVILALRYHALAAVRQSLLYCCAMVFDGASKQLLQQDLEAEAHELVQWLERTPLSRSNAQREWRQLMLLALCRSGARMRRGRAMPTTCHRGIDAASDQASELNLLPNTTEYSHTPQPQRSQSTSIQQSLNHIPSQPTSSSLNQPNSLIG